MTEHRDVIFADIATERDRQDDKWGGKDNDAKNTMTDWRNYIVSHAQEASEAATLGDIKQARKHLVEVAALAVAALEMLDRIGEYDDANTAPGR